ncbi:MAG: threonylcarbamoyl-AMP synthase [Nitrospinae bacterium]|nr:threonylcarbamoyl-AMP synthase [Nitrospinota bacterium]
MPEIIKIDLDDETVFRTQMVKIKRILNLGGVMAFPTDTFYGLGATAFNRKAVSRIFKIKQRPKDKPLLTLVASAYQVNSMALEITPTAEILIEKLWPGPLTILFSAHPHLPSQLTANTGKIGVRQPGNEMVRKLLSGIGFPITATSANISGTENVTTAREVEETLGSQIDLIVDGGAAPGGKESTVLDVTLSPSLLVREGAVTREEIDAILDIPCIAVP